MKLFKMNEKGCVAVGMLLVSMLGVGIVAIGDNYRRGKEAKQTVEVSQSSQVCTFNNGSMSCVDKDLTLDK